MKKKVHTAEFKAKVALEAVKSGLTANQIASKHELPAHLLEMSLRSELSLGYFEYLPSSCNSKSRLSEHRKVTT